MKQNRSARNTVKMGGKSRVLLNYFLFLCMICVVFCDHQTNTRNHNKRDVHRIILQERNPRSHKNHGHSRKRGNRKVKKTSDESNSSSFENSGSYSGEDNSFEDLFLAHKSNSKQSKKKPSFSRHRFPSNLAIEETRQHFFRQEQPFLNSDWVPLNTDQHLPLENHYSHHHHQEQHRGKDKRNKRKSKKHFNIRAYQKNVDFPSSLPSLSSTVPFDSSTFYPPVDVLSTFTDLNKKLLENNPGIISSFDQTNFKPENVDKLKNHKPSYDVTESSTSDFGSFIVVPDKSGSVELASTGKFNVKDLTGHFPINKSTPNYRSKPKF